jgi:hypothetical protein
MCGGIAELDFVHIFAPQLRQKRLKNQVEL